MKKCPYCGAQNADDSRFCTECGKEIPQGNVCPHCGASVNEGDAFCQNCGRKIEVSSSPSLEIKSKECPHCGAPISNEDIFCQKCGEKVDNSPNASVPASSQSRMGRGKLFLKWDGKWALSDPAIKVSVDGNHIGDFSFKEGFNISVPITSEIMNVETKFSIRKTKSTLVLNPNENYTYNYVYDSLTGGFGYVLTDENGDIIKSDVFSWWKYLLCFSIPIVGFIYAIHARKNPSNSKGALWAAITGFLVGLCIFFLRPYLSGNFNEKAPSTVVNTVAEETAIAEDVAVDTVQVEPMEVDTTVADIMEEYDEGGASSAVESYDGSYDDFHHDFNSSSYMHHNLTGTFTDNTGVYPIEISFSNKGNEVSNVIYKNVKVGSKIPLVCTTFGNNRICFEGKDGKNSFVISLNNTESDSFVGSASVGDKDFDVEVTAECSH